MFLGCALLAGSITPTYAAEPKPRQTTSVVCPICGRIRDERADYATKAGNTFVRGTTNALLGWTELIRQPAQEVKTKGGTNTRNVLNGIVKGIGQGAARTVSGAAELLTFWAPKMQGKYIRFATDCPLCMGQQMGQQQEPQKTP